ncbi:MAG: outer membrane protein assembly factor BamA [Limnohabitans sp.]|jgi:outer membrane protein insertion porin family|nr:outer membrane protein assembly factor BamA [Limnohabitans sp.]
MTHHLMRPFLTLLRGVVACLVMVQLAWAVEPFEIKDIRIEGLQRVEPGTVFASTPFRIGDTYTDDKATSAIRTLFGLGLFKDLRIDVNNGVVVIVVEERPVIAAVDFVGAKEFDKEVLRKSLRDVGLAEGRPYDRALADRAEQELKRQYINRSLYGAEVITTITPIERNRVNLTFSVIEGDVSKIKDIRIVGNKVFSESTLRDQFDLNTGNWLSWYTKSDRYSRAKLNADLETLRSYYLSRGYLEFRVDSTQVSISPNKQDITITINVTEGERFGVAAVRLEGYFLGRDEEFKSLVTIKPGQPYNVNDVTQTVKAFSDYFGNFGFAFARIEPRPDIDRASNLVTVVLQADPSRRAYVRRINVSGNARTRDEIIRREFRQMESAWYDGDRIRLSRDRVERLGFFKEVTVDTQEVAGSPDQVDLVVNVVEKPTGALQIGAGYSSFEKLFLTFGIQQDNIFGTGNYLGTQVSTSKYNQIFTVNYTDPYFTDDGIARTVDFFHRASKPYIEQAGNYRLITTGLGLRFGIPASELSRFTVGASVEETTIQVGSSMPAAYLNYVERFGTTSRSTPLSLGWVRDSRDSPIVPTRGGLSRVYSDWAVAGDTRYVRYGGGHQQFIALTKQYSLALNADVGFGKGLSGYPYPVFKNYFVGGLGSVRGFDQGSLGPRDLTGLILGGTKKVVMNAEFQMPFPGAGNDRTLRLYTFLDAGNVYGEYDKIDVSTLRSSFGMGFSWVSPMGPLRLAIARPITKFAGDRILPLQFQVGNTF